MPQLSLRIDDGLHAELRHAAASHDLSVNAFLTKMLEAALTPSRDEPEIERIRARLVSAGLVAPSRSTAVPPRSKADEAAFRAARRRSHGGTPGSEIVAADRGPR